MTDNPKAAQELDNQQYADAIYQCARSYNATYYDKDFEDWKRLSAIHKADMERTAKLFGVPLSQVIQDSSDCYTENFMYLREIEAEEAKNRNTWSLKDQIRINRLAEQAAAHEEQHDTKKDESA